MASAEPMVVVRDLRKKYETLTAVDGVSFEIKRGEIFGLLGPNGAGKTTTISMLAGILPSTSGEITLAGKPHQSNADVKRLLGVVPQELAIYPRLTGRENVEFFGQLYGQRGAQLTERMNATLALVGLSERAGDRADTYSGGMKRRLNLAIGLMHNPQLLLLDEPTVGVDPQSRNHIFEGVRALNQQGLTILYTSHYMEEVEALCDRVGIMDRGKLIACDTVPNLIAGLGGATIEVGVGGVPDAAVLERLERIESVQDVKIAAIVDGDLSPEPDGLLPHAHRSATLVVRTDRPNAALPGLVTILNGGAVAIHSLAIKQPNLEDVFLALTGKTLRD